MTKNNMKFRQLLTRCTAVPVAFVGLALNAFADNKVTIEDFSIKLNEEKTVAIYLENTDDIAALQMDIVLPKELSYVSNSIVRNEERLDRDTHSLMMQRVDSDNDDVNIYRLLIVPSSMDNIEGNSGAIAYFTVTADAFNEVDKIRFENIVGSRLPDGSADTKVEVTSDVTTVSPYAGFVQMGTEALEIKTDGTSKKVDVQLTNHITVRNMEAVITLPAGLSFEMNEKGKPKFDYGTRLPQNATISSNVMADGSMKVVIAGVTNQSFEGNEGTVFSFYVKADENLAQNSEIIISDVLVTDGDANAYVIDEPAKQAVVNAYIAYYEPAMKVVDELKSRFDAAVEKINTEAPTVKDSVLVTDSIAKVGAQVENLRKAVEQAYQDETLAENSETVLAPVANIDQAIEEMVGYALALEQGLVNNEAAYQRLTAEIAAAQTELDAATEKINKECAAVAAQFAETLAGIKAQIDALTADVKAQYEAGKLTAESTVDLTAVKDATTKVVADAAAAQAAYEANEAAYVRLNGEIATAQTELDAATEKINTECAAVAAQFAETLAGIKAQIDALTADVKAQYEAGKLTAESTVDLTAVKKAVEKVVADAAAAQAVVDANEAAYERLSAEIAAVQTQLDSTKKTIETECAAVAEDYVATLESLQSEIDGVSADLKKQYDAVALNENSKVYLNGIISGINKALKDAQAGQAAVEANQAAYERLTAVIAVVQKQLDDAKNKIETEYADVADQFKETAQTIQIQINTLTADLQNRYEAGKLTAESTVETSLIEGAITKMLADASGNQAAVIANEAAYKRLTAEIATVQTQLDNAKKTIETECADVAANYVAALESLQSDIDGISADVKKQYEAVSLNENSKVYLSAITSGIATALKDAQAAQAAFDANEAAVAANEAAYERLNAEIAAVQTKLDNAKKTIETEYAAVAAQFENTIAGIQSQIKAVADDVKAQYEAVKLTADSKVDLTEVQKAIAQVVTDAAAAQEAHEADEAAKAANEAAYERLTAEIAAVQTELDNAKKTIETECADVAEDYVATLEKLQSEIDGVSADLKKQYEAVALDENSKVYLTGITSGIAKALKDAQAGQAAVTANETAYERLNAEIAAVQAELDAAIEKINTECPDVADQFTAEMETLQMQIDGVQEDLDAKYEAVSLDENSKVYLSAVTTGIKKMVEDAVAAQDQATGINDVQTGANQVVAIYTVTGAKVEKPVKGSINIFKYADGSIKKIFVK